eukprot:Opistho-2@62255
MKMLIQRQSPHCGGARRAGIMSTPHAVAFSVIFLFACQGITTTDALWCVPYLANECNGRGTCLASGTCVCLVGYTGTNCESCIRDWWGPSIISNQGVSIQINCQQCVNCGPHAAGCKSDTGACVCMDGWAGTLCEACDASKTCNGNGICTPPQSQTCNCSLGYTGANCENCAANWWGPVTYRPTSGKFGQYSCQPCSCGPNALSPTCDSSTGACACKNSGFSGNNCDQCAPGYWGASCQACPLCDGIQKCSDGLAGTGTCSCPNGGYGPNCSCDPSLTCLGRGICGLDGNCSCRGGYYGSNCEKFCPTSEMCDGRPYCAANGVCIPDSTSTPQPLLTCPIGYKKSGVGSCVPCNCKGLYCSEENGKCADVPKVVPATVERTTALSSIRLTVVTYRSECIYAYGCVTDLKNKVISAVATAVSNHDALGTNGARNVNEAPADDTKHTRNGDHGFRDVRATGPRVYMPAQVAAEISSYDARIVTLSAYVYMQYTYPGDNRVYTMSRDELRSAVRRDPFFSSNLGVANQEYLIISDGYADTPHSVASKGVIAVSVVGAVLVVAVLAATGVFYFRIDRRWRRIPAQDTDTLAVNVNSNHTANPPVGEGARDAHDGLAGASNI